MAWVSIHDYTLGKVLLIEYDDFIKDVEEEVVKELVSGEYEYMCMNDLNLEIKSKNLEV